MRHLLVLALLLSGAAFAQDPKILGTTLVDGHEIKIFDTRGSCARNAGMEAYRTPSMVERKPYDIGCWKPLNEENIIVVFKDGTFEILGRKDLVTPRGRLSL